MQEDRLLLPTYQSLPVEYSPKCCRLKIRQFGPGPPLAEVSRGSAPDLPLPFNGERAGGQVVNFKERIMIVQPNHTAINLPITWSVRTA